MSDGPPIGKDRGKGSSYRPGRGRGSGKGGYNEYDHSQYQTGRPDSGASNVRVACARCCLLGVFALSMASALLVLWFVPSLLALGPRGTGDRYEHPIQLINNTVALSRALCRGIQQDTGI